VAGLSTEPIGFVLDGRAVTVPAGGSLLDALREHLGIRSAKDGCSPQGQCGCCTVLIDGRPRVSCVTPVARARGRAITTVDGLADAARWAEAFTAHGATQCGFCTPGIIVRAAALTRAERSSPDAVRTAMLAHLCRCTGWNTIVDAVTSFDSDVAPATPVAVTQGPAGPVPDPARSTARTTPRSSAGTTAGGAAARRARLEGGVSQAVGPSVALGRGGFADDTAPSDALVALRGADGTWVVGDSLEQARQLSGKVQGRRTTAPIEWPIEPPRGTWVRTLQTTWVEPAYLEPDASWCEPGGEPVSSYGNGGAFGGKQTGELAEVARRLAAEHGRPVRVLHTREDVVRFGPKRPPMAAGVRADGTGTVRVARTPGIVEAIHAVAPGFAVDEVDVPGPPTSVALRGAGWVEAAILLASSGSGPEYTITAPGGAVATASIADDGSVAVRVACGDPLDLVVLRSYCVGAAHMALGWVTSEGLSVDADGVPHDLTVRSFGVLRAVDTPPIEIEIDAPAAGAPERPVNGSDAVFAAVATAAWSRTGWAARWPTDRRLRSHP
jgi:aerobic-type carbon monoxide dehydrogenase small subunit (CoxS/CutS family)